MNLITPRLFLREIAWSDLENIHRLNAYPEVAKFNTIGIPKDREATRTVMRAAVENHTKNPRTIYSWAVFTQTDDTFIGQAGMSLFPVRYRRSSIFYNLVPAHWGQGYASEVAHALVRFGFDTLHLHRIEAGVAVENAASVRVLEKVGMTREGVSRKILPTPGGWRDNYRYAILEDDPR